MTNVTGFYIEKPNFFLPLMNENKFIVKNIFNPQERERIQNFHFCQRKR